MAAPLTPSQDVLALMKFVVQSVVDDPVEVSVNIREGEQTTVYVISAPKSEIGKIIGKEGRMAHALRTLLYSYSSKRGFRAVLEIAE